MLQVITNDTFKKVFKPKCTVQIDDTKQSFTDFVVVGYDPATGNTEMVHNTDAVTLGQALLMLKMAFAEAIIDLTEEQKAEVLSVLEEGLIV